MERRELNDERIELTTTVDEGSCEVFERLGLSI